MGTQENENADRRSATEGSGYCITNYFQRSPASELLSLIHILTAEYFPAYTCNIISASSLTSTEKPDA